jgi:hypothetical protein
MRKGMVAFVPGNGGPSREVDRELLVAGAAR